MNHKALFIHISKCGGGSVQTKPWILVHGSPDESPRRPLEAIPSLELSFTFVRNPYTRFTSAVLGHEYCAPHEFEEWVTEEFQTEAAAKIAQGKWVELRPQWRYIMHEGSVDVDFIGRFEHIQEDWRRACDLAGVEYEHLPHANKNRYNGHEKYHTERTRKIVERFYTKDFEILNRLFPWQYMPDSAI